MSINVKQTPSQATDTPKSLRLNFKSAFTKILIPFDLFSNLVIKPWLKIIPLNIILFVKCNYIFA